MKVETQIIISLKGSIDPYPEAKKILIVLPDGEEVTKETFLTADREKLWEILWHSLFSVVNVQGNSLERFNSRLTLLERKYEND